MHTHCIQFISQSKKGSFLLEVLLSIVIFSSSLTLIIGAMTSGLRAMSYSAQYTKAANVLENEMVDLIFTNLKGSQLADIQGDALTDENYTISSQSEPLNDSYQEHIKDVHLTISWPFKQKNAKMSINTYFIEGINP